MTEYLWKADIHDCVSFLKRNTELCIIQPAISFIHLTLTRPARTYERRKNKYSLRAYSLVTCSDVLISVFWKSSPVFYESLCLVLASILWESFLRIVCEKNLLEEAKVVSLVTKNIPSTRKEWHIILFLSFFPFT